MFEQLVLVDHPNIVKLHKYWLDVKDSKARVGTLGGHWGTPALLLTPLLSLPADPLSPARSSSSQSMCPRGASSSS